MRQTGSLSRRGAFLSVSVVSGLALVIAVQGITDDFLSSPLFVVREIQVVWLDQGADRPDRFRLRPATSVFRIDLGALSRAFQRRYPTVEVQEIHRFLPNRLVAQMRPRQVIAQMKSGGRYFSVSDDGTIVSKGQPTPMPGLPLLVLEGQEQGGALQLGRSIADPDFWRAAAVLTGWRRSKAVAGWAVKSVQVKGADLFLLLETGPEIRFASDRFAEGWRRLAELMARRPDVLETAGYMDLRFEDPVIGGKGKGKGKGARRR